MKTNKEEVNFLVSFVFRDNKYSCYGQGSFGYEIKKGGSRLPNLRNIEKFKAYIAREKNININEIIILSIIDVNV